MISPNSCCSLESLDPTTRAFGREQDVRHRTALRQTTAIRMSMGALARIASAILRIERLRSVAVCRTSRPLYMSFQIRPLKEFLVRPAVPPELDRLPELAYNLIWSWQHSLRAVFRRLDPVLWKACNHNPVVLLGRLTEEALERAAHDPRYLALYKRACETHDTYLK